MLIEKLKNLVIRFIWIGTIIYVIIAGYYIYNSYEESKNDFYNKIYTNGRDLLSRYIEEKKNTVNLISLTLSNNENIKNFILYRDKYKINLSNLSNKLKKLGFNYIWFHLISSDGKTLYSSWDNKRGNSILKFRKDIRYLLKNPHTLSSISVGMYDLSFKSIKPIYKNDKFLGFIEVIGKFNSISSMMRKKWYKTIILVDKSYKNQLKHPFTKKFLGDYYVVNLDADPSLLNYISKKGINNILNIKNYIVDRENNLLISNYRLYDIDGKNMAYIILFYKITPQDYKNIYLDIREKIVFIIGLYLGILALLYMIYFLYYKKYSEIERNRLYREIKKHTTKINKKNETLKYHISHDTLTGLTNRRFVKSNLLKILKRANKNASEVFIILIDLHSLKDINEQYGHRKGDKVIQEVANRLQKYFGKYGFVSRFAGDEFLLAFENIDKEKCIELLKKINDIISRKINLEHHTIEIGANIGVVSYPKDGNNILTLMKNLDMALSYAKKDKEKYIYFYDKRMTEDFLKRIHLEKDIRTALKNGEFIPYFQPKFDAVTNQVIGLESLIRWKHPEKGLIPPNEFIPFAEESDLIIEIDNYIIKKAMKQILEWKAENIEMGILSVNISARQFASKDFLKNFINILNEVGFNPNDLEIEILERQLVDDPERTKRVLNDIRSYGIGISVDDFGTGYSSLAYLKNFPLTRVKIDRTFIKDLPNDKKDISIVKTIIALSENLGFDVIAEGAETKEQVDFLVENGCRYIQGYYFSKPLSPKECKEFLLSRREDRI